MTETSFNCSVCGKEDTVPFVPREGASLLCRECQAVYKQVQQDKAAAERAKIPRKAHNTRVSFPIVCPECGKEETLSYVPKGVPLSEVLCTECQSSKLGENSRYVAKAKEIEQERAPKVYKVPCASCDEIILMTKKPWPGREYECESCFKGFARAKDGVLDDAEVVAGTGGMMRKRKKKA